MKISSFLSVGIFLITLNCKSDQKEIVTKAPMNIAPQMKYKKWLKDTLVMLQNEKASTSLFQTYTVNKDSTSLNIKTKIDTVLDSKNNYSKSSKELQYGISLLRRNNILPLNQFRLIMISDKYYDQPFKNVGLIYDFQIDIPNFYITTDGLKKEYKFIKGNLTDSTTISSLPNIKTL